MKTKKEKMRNFVEKHRQRCGEGFHVSKLEKHWSRSRRKSEIEKEARRYENGADFEKSPRFDLWLFAAPSMSLRLLYDLNGRQFDGNGRLG